MRVVLLPTWTILPTIYSNIDKNHADIPILPMEGYYCSTTSSNFLPKNLLKFFQKKSHILFTKTNNSYVLFYYHLIKKTTKIKNHYGVQIPTPEQIPLIQKLPYGLRNNCNQSRVIRFHTFKFLRFIIRSLPKTHIYPIPNSIKTKTKPQTPPHNI